MCGQTASLPRVSMIELGAFARQDTIPEGQRVIATSNPWRVAKGSERAEAVAAHLRIHNRSLVQWWDMPMYSDETKATFQAGAAATETMANLLDALNAGDAWAARRVIEQFVNDAVDTGVVAVG